MYTILNVLDVCWNGIHLIAGGWIVFHQMETKTQRSYILYIPPTANRLRNILNLNLVSTDRFIARAIPEYFTERNSKL